MRDEAAIGIGTIIVFVATALVAAVAAGILISAGSDVQKVDRDELGFHVAQVVGQRLAPTDPTLHGVDVYLVADGGVDAGGIQVALASAGREVDGAAFTMQAHHDPDGSIAEGIMQEGDVAVLRIQLGPLALGPGDVVAIEVGNGASSITLERSIGLFGDALVVPL